MSCNVQTAVEGAAEVDFWLVNDPLINLNRGRLVKPAQLASLPRVAAIKSGQMGRRTTWVTNIGTGRYLLKPFSN